MNNSIREYENLYVFDNLVDELFIKNILLNIKNKIISYGGKNLKIEFIGKKKLFNNKAKVKIGLYFKHSFICMPDKIFDFNNFLRINKNIILKQNLLMNINLRLEMFKEFELNFDSFMKDSQQV